MYDSTDVWVDELIEGFEVFKIGMQKKFKKYWLFMFNFSIFLQSWTWMAVHSLPDCIWTLGAAIMVIKPTLSKLVMLKLLVNDQEQPFLIYLCLNQNDRQVQYEIITGKKINLKLRVCMFVCVFCDTVWFNFSKEKIKTDISWWINGNDILR